MTLERSLYDEPALYDRVVAPPAASLGFYLDEARRGGGDVLELACGTGRLTIPIARALAPEGRRVTALDLAPAMLDAAQRKAADATVDIELVVGDMRRFKLDRRFDTIFVAFNSLLHLTTNDELRHCFACVREHLAPDGAFVFDIFNPSIKLLARAPEERSTVARVADEELGEIHLETTIDYDAATQVNRATWYISTPDQRDAWTVPLFLRSIFPQELPLLLSAAGLELINRFGELDRAPFGARSRVQVCLCRRSGA